MSASTSLPDLTVPASLGSADYCSPAVLEAERARIFHAGWFYVCHVDGLPPGSKRAVDVAGRSILVTRDRDGEVHAFANVCRHRGSELCPGPDAGPTTATRGSVRCGYHAWTYGLDGALLATPRVDDDLDRSRLGLWPHHAAMADGLIFVSLAERPPPLPDWLADHSPDLARFADLPVGEYRIGGRTETVVAANWKILVENYAECLHCVVVHPELVDLIPIYRTGHVVDPDRDDGGVDFVTGADAFTAAGTTTLSVLPGYDQGAEYNGTAIFPNAFFDLTPTVLAITALFPLAPDRTAVVGEYLFAAADVARPDFDPSAEIELNELVGRQDNQVCEAVQRGVASPAFTGGVLTAKDRYVAEFVRRYLDIRGPVGSH